MTEGFTPSAPPMERPKRGPKPGTKRGPRKAVSNGTEQPANTTDHDVLCGVVAIGKLIGQYPPDARTKIVQALGEMFSVPEYRP